MYKKTPKQNLHKIFFCGQQNKNQTKNLFTIYFKNIYSIENKMQFLLLNKNKFEFRTIIF